MNPAPRLGQRRHLACVVWLAAVVAGACVNGPPGEAESAASTSAQQRPAWLDAVEVHVERTKPAFEQNTEVFVRLVNPSGEPITIQGLDAEGAAALLHDGGVAAGIHAISVGVKKPIAIRARDTKSTSLLFEAVPGSGVPIALRLYDRAFPISATEAQ